MYIYLTLANSEADMNLASMLKENPQSRPNIFKALTEVCSMRGTTVPIKDVRIP
jgi:hypothetical protein